MSKLNDEFSLFDKVIAEFKNEWKAETLKTTIDGKWDHALIQAFFFSLGKKLGFKVGCEKFRKWDVTWLKEDEREDNYIEVEVELRTQTKIATTFSKICRTNDALFKQFEKSENQWRFSGILVINYYLEGQTALYKDYFFDFVLNPEKMLMDIYYPKNRVLNLLVVDIEKKAYRYAKVGLGRNYQIISDGRF